MLDTDSLILAVSNHNPLSKKSIVTLEELKKQRLILRLPDSATRNLFISHLETSECRFLQEVPLPENCARER